MDRLNERLQVAQRAVASLQEALKVKDPSLLERDGSIQRFEYSFEAIWKAAQAFLTDNEGIETASPKSCVRALGQVGILGEADTALALRMVVDRNLTVHTYNQALAHELYNRLPQHANLLEHILAGMVKRQA